MTDFTQDRPNIDSTLDSLKSAMTAENDQILEDETLTSPSETLISDEVVEEVFTKEVFDEGEEVFSSEDDNSVETEDEVAPLSGDVFVLTKMIQEDGTILNIDTPNARPEIPNISDEKIEGIAKPIIFEWLERNIHRIVKK
jgi:hypothetical protein